MTLAATSVVLVEPAEPGNVGAAARVMKNLGLRELVLVAPKEPPLHGVARAFSAGASDLLRAARVVPDLAAAVAKEHVTIALTGVQGRHRTLDCVDAIPENLVALIAPGARVALVFGREESGLTQDEANMCSYRWRLPTVDDFPSLNLAQAVGIALTGWREALRRRTGLPPLDVEANHRVLTPISRRIAKDAFADQQEVTRLLDHLRETMLEADYQPGERTEQSLTLMRSLLARANPTHREVQLLRGILRQALGRMKRPRGTST